MYSIITRYMCTHKQPPDIKNRLIHLSAIIKVQPRKEQLSATNHGHARSHKNNSNGSNEQIVVLKATKKKKKLYLYINVIRVQPLVICNNEIVPFIFWDEIPKWLPC